MNTAAQHLLRASALSALALAGLAAQADTLTRVTRFEYDAAGLLSKQTIEPNRPNDCLQASISRDAFGHTSTLSRSTCAGASAPATNSAGTRAGSNTYSSDGRFVLTSTNALGQSETKTYDGASGQLLSLTGPNGLSTNWQYDSLGRKTRETRAGGTYSTWSYALCTDAGANCPGPIAGAASVWVITEQSYAVNGAANAPQQRSYLDALGRVVRVQTQGFDGGGAAPTLVQDTEYNALGQVARKSDFYALAGGSPVWSSYSYDALGRLTSQSTPDPAAAGGIATTTFGYNALVSTVTNAKGQTKTTTKNARDQIASVVDAQGNTISYSYNAQGNLTSTNAAGSITTMGYDIRGNKTSMLDPAMGSWTYSYNAYGELVGQRDSLNQSSTLSYDALGRMTQRSEPDLISQWSYDAKFDGSACGKGIGKLCEAKANNGYQRTHSYDSLGRMVQTATVLDDAANPATVSESFDANTGKITSKTWPTGYQASYSYTALGYLSSVTGGGTNGFTQTVSYQVQAMNANGQITQYRTGNAVTTVNTFDAQTHRLSAIQATTDGQGSGNVLKQSFAYDALGNLTSRNDTSPSMGTQENFSYDSLNRLTMATLLGGAVSPPSTTEVQYDVRGNITYKSDVGRYWYDSARPNRMTAVTLETAAGAVQTLTGTRALSYAFDDLQSGAQSVNGTQVGNGNLQYTVSHDASHNVHTVRSESYTSFNMPGTISYGNFLTNTTSTQDRTLSYVYGPEHQRTKMNLVLSGVGTTSYFAGNTWYLNGIDSLGLSFEKEVRTNGTVENKHYVSAAGTVFAIFTSRTGTLNGLPATSTSYVHKDHLGSIAAISDASGVVVERMAYDPWGKRRFANTTPGLPDALDAIVGQKTERGYTEHEHLDEIGAIHMNGRIYDPLIGRFMSADPLIQAPANLKSFNRYSYVWNNPLKGFDPTGFLIAVTCSGGVSQDADGGFSSTWECSSDSTGSGEERGTYGCEGGCRDGEYVTYSVDKSGATVITHHSGDQPDNASYNSWVQDTMGTVAIAGESKTPVGSGRPSTGSGKPTTSLIPIAATVLVRLLPATATTATAATAATATTATATTATAAIAAIAPAAAGLAAAAGVVYLVDNVVDGYKNAEGNPLMNLNVNAAGDNTGVGDNAADSADTPPEQKVPKPGVDGKEGAKDVPSWAKGERPNVGENGKDFADRLLGDKYGDGEYNKGPGSEWSKIRKWGDRAFVDPKPK